MLTFMTLTASLEQALLFMPLILGTYLSYRILKLTDLTVEGSFVLGAGTYAQLVSHGMPDMLSLLLAIVAGGVAGFCVSLIQLNNRVQSLFAGILGVFMLYSVNFQIMQRPNINLFPYETFLRDLINFETMTGWIVLVGLIFFIQALLFLLLKSSLGLYLRAFGHQQHLLKRLGHNPEIYRALGLVLSNGLAALSGGLVAQSNGYADLNMGLGVALISIGAVVMGRHLLNRLLFARGNHFLQDFLGCFTGIFFYFFCLNLLLKVGIDPINLKFFLGLMLVIVFRHTTLRKQVPMKQQKRGMPS